MATLYIVFFGPPLLFGLVPLLLPWNGRFGRNLGVVVLILTAAETGLEVNDYLHQEPGVVYDPNDVAAIVGFCAVTFGAFLILRLVVVGVLSIWRRIWRWSGPMDGSNSMNG